MSDQPRWFQTTAIDYPNSRPHIGTAFEKLGADVQARYRRMEGYDVYFLMGNDENTLKVSKRAEELGQDVQAYCDDMARQFREVWDALEISYDGFVQTSHAAHRDCASAFIQKVYDAGHIYKDQYEGWFCPGCEEFKSDKDHTANNGLCPLHKIPLIRRQEPCYLFKLSAFQDRLLQHIEANPDFIQPSTRCNEILSLIRNDGLRDVNISRAGKEWGIRFPFDPDFTVYVWFDALLTYISGIGYENAPDMFQKYWPADVHFIGKDITRFHTTLWPAMLWAAGEEAPKQVFAHGFVQRRDEKGELVRESKALGNVTDPMEIITKFSVDGFRYYFMRECPFPSDGEFSWERFAAIYDSELANNLGNTMSRCITLIVSKYGGTLEGTANQMPEPMTGIELSKFVAEVREHVECCRYNQALQAIINTFMTPTNQALETHAPWTLVKTDLNAAKQVLFNTVQSLRIVSILLKPFIPGSAKTMYTSFNFAKPWDEVCYADAAELLAQPDDLTVTAELVKGKPKPLFQRIS